MHAVAGPVNKKCYIAQLEGLSVYKAFPDLAPNPFGFCVDPDDPLRVWFWVRLLPIVFWWQCLMSTSACQLFISNGEGGCLERCQCAVRSRCLGNGSILGAQLCPPPQEWCRCTIQRVHALPIVPQTCPGLWCAWMQAPKGADTQGSH